MKHISYILIIFLLSICVVAHAQSYEKMWRNIANLQKKDFPQLVINQSLAIFEKAKKEKNCSQMIKSYLTAMQYREEISPDSLNSDIVSLEKWVGETQEVEDRVVLYTILGRIVSETDAPKALKYIQMLMQDASNIVNYSVSTYKPIIDKGDISERYFNNSLLNLIGRENLKTLDRMNNISAEKKQILPETVSTIASFENYNIFPSSDNDYTSQYLIIYQTLLREYKNKGMIDAWIITSADILNSMMDYSKQYDEAKAIANLEKLIKDYPKNEATAYAYSLLIERKYGEMKYVQALDLIKECRAKYAKSPLTKGLAYIEKEILRPSFSASIDNVFAGVEDRIKVNYKNITSFKTSLYYVDPSITALQLFNDRGLYDKVKSNATLTDSQKYELKAHSDYNYHDMDISLKINAPGIYYLELETENGVKDGKIIFATSIIPIVQTIPGNKIKIIAVDALNGKPIGNADFNIYTYSDDGRKYQLENTIKGDANGVIFIDSANKIGKYNITTPSDNGMELRNINSRSYRSYTDYKKEKVSLFSDRSIYKPGQIVHFSGVAYTNSDDSTKVLPLKEYEVSLLDANHVIISTTNVTTDKWGSFNGSFALPANCLNGRFCIRVISCVTSFMVEEYKRPTFEVILNHIENSFALGDTAYVTGCAKTFFGFPLKNVSVKYIIKSRESGHFNDRGVDVVEEKIIKTDKNGCFTIPVAINMSDDRKLRYWYRRYEVSIIVTDDSGESAEAMTSIPCGSSSLILKAHGIKDIILKESNDSVSCEVTNLAGTAVNSIVDINLYRLVEGKKDSVLVIQKQVESNIKFPLKWTNNMKSGEYRIVLKVVDEKDKEAEYTKTFILFSKNDTKAPVDTDSWTYSDDDLDSMLSFGTSRSDVDIYFNLYTKGKTLESKIFNLSDSIITMNCNYKPEYGDGAEITIAFVKNGKLYTFSKGIVKPLPDKRLILKWESFRDKLQPGKNEVWKLKITYPDGKPARAQLVSTMYDASLDAIYKAGWNFNINFTRDIIRHPFSLVSGGSAYFNLDNNDYYYEPNKFEYTHFNLPYLYYNFRSYVQRPLANMYAGRNQAMDMEMMPMVKAMSTTTVMDGMGSLKYEESRVDVRKDFSETAFFYPQLNTDKNGIVNISFLLPESLTKWHFIALAHTENVDYGFIESDITVSKEFMVRPSVPRFLRSGDKCVIPVSVTNLKDRDVKGELRFEMVDPKTNKIIFSNLKKFRLDEGVSTTISFDYTVPQDYSLLICKVSGQGKNFSDGEQIYVPVLSNMEMVTESVPMFMSEKGIYNYTIPSAKDKKVTLEVTANPIWHVVQALPSIMTPNDYSAYSWASALYSSSIIEYLLDKNPAIVQYSKILKSLPKPDSDDSMMSELQKNQELKNIMLQETPWVLKAKSEQEQRMMLLNISDINTARYNKQDAVRHLSELQNSDGSWSWYKDMTGNVYVTADVLEMLARMRILTNKTNIESNTEQLLYSSFNFLKREVDDYYKNEQKQKAKGVDTGITPTWIMKYIYVSTLDNKLESDIKINQYFINKLKNSSALLDIYGKGLCAAIFKGVGMNKEADEFVESLLQYTVYSKDFGRYFDTKRAQCTYTSNIIPAIVSTIEAINSSSNKEDYVKQLKQWLIAMKGMQNWGTNVATTNAIYALLNQENLSLDSDGSGFIKIKAGGETFKISQSEPLGYIKSEINSNINNINIDKSYPGLSYGSVFLQGMQKVDSLNNSSTGLIINKQLYRDGKNIDAKTTLKVGDVIMVKLTIKSPAYMDFVQVKDALYSCMQPLNQLSQVRWNGNMAYNQVVRNASINLFIDKLSKGEHVIEYDVFITRGGEYQPGLTSIESAYFPMMRSIAVSPVINVVD